MHNNQESKKSHTLDRSGWFRRERIVTLVLGTITAIAFYICYQIGLPFLSSISWAAALAIATLPLHNWIISSIKRENIAAGISVLTVSLAILGPGIFLGQTLISQIGKSAQTLKTQTASEQWKSTVESNPKLAPLINSVEAHFDVRSAAERAADAVSSQIASFIGGFIWVLAQIVITFFTLFYFLRDRLLILKTIKSLMPLSQSETDRLFF